SQRIGSWCRRAALALAGLCLSAPAYAQLPTFDQRAPADANNEGADTHLFRPAIDSKGFFSTNGSDIVGSGDFSFGLVLDYGTNLLRTAEPRNPVGANGQLCTSDADCVPDAS